MAQAKITAIGTAVPDKVVNNKYFESIIETTDEWIRTRTGIETRRFATENEFTSHLCIDAAIDMQLRYKVDFSDVDFIIVASVTPDQQMPSVACQIQDKFDIPNCGAIDISAACAGFGYGLVLAQGLVAAGTHKKILVFGAETLTKVTNYSDRTSCILFGDGAGAMLVEAADKGNILGAVTGSAGDGGKDLYISGKRKQINSMDMVMDGKIHQTGRAVFKWAVSTVSELMPTLAEKAGIPLSAIDWFVPHSANMRIIEALCKYADFPLSKILESISIYGNTSSASIPLALDRGVKSGQVKKGDKIMLIGFGGGLVYAGVVIEWALD